MLINKIVEPIGYRFEKFKNPPLPPDFDKEFKVIYEKCKPYTMTSIERMYAMFKATKYIVENKIPGDIVECGVWRGGSLMIAALTLKRLKELNRKIYLYDTFGGMTKPSNKDKRLGFNDSKKVQLKWKRQKFGNVNHWAYAPLEEVIKNIKSTGYPENRFVIIPGKVEDTIPAKLPKSISLLRLDTDWYESTYHELKYLFPLLEKEGVLIIDDYGHWEGSKNATEKYFSRNNVKIFLSRIDYTGRLGIKL